MENVNEAEKGETCICAEKTNCTSPSVSVISQLIPYASRSTFVEACIECALQSYVSLYSHLCFAVVCMCMWSSLHLPLCVCKCA